MKPDDSTRQVEGPVLVTGATGFVGAAVARLLAREGLSLRLLTRPSSDRRNLAGLEAEPVVGDLRDVASLREAVRGCAVVFHVAADYRLWARRPRDLYESNVDGTVNLMLAAAEAGCRRIVYTSSVATLGTGAAGSPAPYPCSWKGTPTACCRPSPAR